MGFLYEMTVYITVTTLILLLFKHMLKSKLSARVQLWLWLVLAVRLVFPVLPESEVSVFNAVNPSGYELSGSVATPAGEGFEVHIPGESPELTGDKSIDTEKLILIIWMSGMLLLFFGFLAVYISYLKKLGKYREIPDEDFRECKRLVGVRRSVALLSGQSGPALVGVVKPKIVMPDGYSEEERRNIILHELCHLKNNDILILWLGLAVLCVNWFNPVVWYAFSVLKSDVELYCDQRAVEYAKSKKDYAELLLKATIKQSRFIAGTTAIGGGEKEITKRIKHMAGFKKPGVLWCVIIAVLSAVIALVCLTDSYTDCLMEEDTFIKYTENIVGSEMADIDYADEKRVIFHYGYGLYSYNIAERRIERAYDLKKLSDEINGEGFIDLAITISADGKEALITTTEMNSYKDGAVGDFIIKLDSAGVREAKMPWLKKPFKNGDNFYEAAGTLPDIKGWTSYGCIKAGGKYYLLTLDKGFEIRDIKLIEADERKNVLNEYFPFTPKRRPVEGKGFGFYAPDENVIKGDYPEIIEDGQIGFAENIKIEDFRSFKSINNHSENTAKKDIYGYRNRIHQVIEEYTQPAASGKNESESLTVYFIGYPTKTDEYAAIYFNSGSISDSDVNYMLSSFRFYVSELYEETKEYMMAEFYRVYSPIYEILDLSISGWEQNGNTATFFYKMTEKNYDKDPDTVEYIKKAREEGSKHYETYKREYLMPRESNYLFKVVKDENGLTLREHIGHRDEWALVEVDDYVVSNWSKKE